MSRIRFAVLGVCAALAACGEKFVASNGSATNGASAGADAEAAGVAETGGSAGQDSSADAGAANAGNESGGGGGVLATGGAGGRLGNAGGSAAGAGGSLIEPMLPQAGLLLWLRADLGIQQKDGHVQVWLDQSGNQINATQVGANRPTYLTTGFNGRPTLEFDAEQEQFLKFAEGFGDFSKGLAGFIVAKQTKSACASMLEFSNGSEVDDIALGMYEDKWAYEVAVEVLHAGTIDHDAFSLYAVNHRPLSATELRINGSVKDTFDMMPLPNVPDSGVRVNNFVGHTLYQGGCEYFTGQLSEIILYSRTLTNSEVTRVEQYLDTHWALSEQDTPTPTP